MMIVVGRKGTDIPILIPITGYRNLIPGPVHILENFWRKNPRSASHGWMKKKSTELIGTMKVRWDFLSIFRPPMINMRNLWRLFPWVTSCRTKLRTMACQVSLLSMSLGRHHLEKLDVVSQNALGKSYSLISNPLISLLWIFFPSNAQI